MKKYFLENCIAEVYTNRYEVEREMNEEGNEVLFISYETDEELEEIKEYISNLIRVKSNLYDGEDFLECYDCGDIVERDNATQVASGKYVCEDCLDNYMYCERCGEYHPNEDIVRIEDIDEYWCDNCAERYATRCSDCGDWVKNDYSTTYDGRYICRNCLEDYYICDNCGYLVHYEYVIDNDNDYHYCPNCEHCVEKKWVRSYHNNPIRVCNHLPDEVTNKYIGCEIETERGDYDERVETTVRHGQEEDFIYQMKDGSLDDDGIECITQPMSKKFFDQFNFEDWFKDLREAGARSHDTENCGLHIHLSREWLGEDKERQDIICGICVEVMSEFKSKLNKFARRSSERWASYDEIEESKTFKEKVENAQKKGAEKYSRYRALNRLNRHTIEFRIFKGTLNPETFRASVEMCIRLVEFSKWIYNHKRKDYNWYDFLTFKKMTSVLAQKIEQFVR